MPTVIVFEVSLSMALPVTIPFLEDDYQRRHLAIHGINTLLNYIEKNCSMESVALLIFSSLYEVKVDFTRNVSAIKSVMSDLGFYDKTCVENALKGTAELIKEQWGLGVPCNVVLVTDGEDGVGPGSLQHSLANLTKGFPLPFEFPSSLHIMVVSDCIADDRMKEYEELVRLNNNEGAVWVQNSILTFESILKTFTSLAETCFTPFVRKLQCANLASNIQLYPAPKTLITHMDVVKNGTEKWNITGAIKICGFISAAEVGYPDTVSRHLVMPAPGLLHQRSIKKSDDADEATVPHLAVMLHGGLKQDAMVALVELGEPAWFGMLYPFPADSRKKSSLTLSIFPPGVDVVPWFGPLHQLTLSEFGELVDSVGFPVRTESVRSYADSSTTMWAKSSHIQTDVQKVLRHARRLPEKLDLFYKDVNRILVHAIATGFYELLEGVASTLERETLHQSGNIHPSSYRHMQHVAHLLRRAANGTNPTEDIKPLRH